MYIELARDSHKIIDAVGNEEVTEVLTMLRKDKNPYYLDFLSVLCECKGVAVHKQQNRIVNLLLRDQSMADSVLYQTQFLEGNIQVRTNSKDSWKTLRE
jgi:hypothetical protein